jgi:VIT1/CCC1 family predicted Fe2+/Mn2+ transporter
MPRTCTACSHPHRDIIDRLLLEGTPLRNIAKRFSLSAAGLFRHNKHLSTTLANSHKEAEITRADGLIEHLNRLTGEAERLKRKAEKAGDYRTALAGVREESRLLELAMTVAAEMESRRSADSELGDRPVNTLTNAQLLRLLAREFDVTEAEFLRMARGQGHLSEARTG